MSLDSCGMAPLAFGLERNCSKCDRRGRLRMLTVAYMEIESIAHDSSFGDSAGGVKPQDQPFAVDRYEAALGAQPIDEVVVGAKLSCARRRAQHRLDL